MKGAIAAFVAAATSTSAAVAARAPISLLITGDEEGPATDGTVRVLEWMAGAGRKSLISAWSASRPTRRALGEVIKIGRRGSLNAAVTGARDPGPRRLIPHQADNPVHRLLLALAALTAAPLDAGSEWFEPSALQVTSIDVGNPASNVIPASATARLNIRFNDRHTGAALHGWLRAAVSQHAERFELDVSVSGESFLTTPGAFGGAAARGHRAGLRHGAAARHRGGHLGRALHRPVLPGGGVRAGGGDDAPGR